MKMDIKQFFELMCQEAILYVWVFCSLCVFIGGVIDFNIQAKSDDPNYVTSVLCICLFWMPSSIFIVGILAALMIPCFILEGADELCKKIFNKKNKIKNIKP